MEDEKAVYYIYFSNVKNSAAENGNGWKHDEKTGCDCILYCL